MKTLLLFGAIALSINSFSQVPSYAPTNGLVGWWGFNGNANDESVNTNDGVVNGATLTTDRDGNVDAAYSFDGVDNKIEMDYVFDFPERTISGWFNLSQYSASNQAIIVNDSPALNNGLINLNVFADDTLGMENGTVPFMSIKPTLNTWYFVTSSRDATTTKFYVNGIEQGQVVNDVIVSASASGQMLRVGTNRFGTQAYFNGLIDDIGLWNRALTDCEITELYTGTQCDLGIESNTLNGNKQLLKIVDLMGRETTFKPNTVLIYIYSDGTTEKVFKMD